MEKNKNGLCLKKALVQSLTFEPKEILNSFLAPQSWQKSYYLKQKAMKILYYSNFPEPQPLPSAIEQPKLESNSYPKPVRFLINFWQFSLYYGNYLVRRS